MITTGYITDMFLSFVLRTTSWVFSQVDVWCLRLHVLHEFSFLHSLARCFVPVQLKQSFDTGYRIANFRVMISFVTVNVDFLLTVSLFCLVLSHVFDVLELSSENLLGSFQPIVAVVLQIAQSPNCACRYLFLLDRLWFVEVYL